MPEDIKIRRLNEIITLQRKHSESKHQAFVGQTVEILIEKESKKSDQHWSGRRSQNTVAVFPKGDY